MLYKQKGFLLLEALMLLTIASIALTLYLSTAAKNVINDSLEVNAVKWAEINNGLRAYVSDNKVSILSSPNSSFTDVKFLKSSSCSPAGTGTGSISYLPCGFSSSFFLGLSSMTITIGTEFNVTGSGSSSVATAQTIIGPKLILNKHRLDLTELMINKAQSRSPLISAPVGAATFINYDYDKIQASPTFGQLISSVDTVESNGSFLRTDGSNFMQADLRVGDGIINHDIVAVRDIVNGRDISMTGNGTYGGTLTSVGNITSSTGNISTNSGNISSAGTLTAATGITSTNGDIVASSGNINATTGNMTAGGTVLGGDVRTFGTNGTNGRSLRFSTAEAGVVLMTLVGVEGQVSSYLAANITKPTCDTGLVSRPFGSIPHKAYINGDATKKGEDLEAVDGGSFWSYRYRIYSAGSINDWVSPSPSNGTFLQYNVNCLP